jgi:hypothetical protein
MAINAGDILEFAYLGTLYGQRVMTVLHYTVSVAPTEQNPLVGCTNFLNRTAHGATNDLVSNYLGCISSDYTLDFTTAQYIAPTRFVRRTLAAGIAGALASPARTPNTAATLTKTTDKSGRRYRGSVHLPGVPDNRYANGVLDATMLGYLASLAATLISDVTEATGTGVWAPCIWHRHKPVTTDHDAVAAIVAQTTVRVMRRRTVGVGK